MSLEMQEKVSCYIWKITQGKTGESLVLSLSKSKFSLLTSSIYKQIDVSFSCVCPVIDHELRHHIVKVALDPRGESLVDPQTITNCQIQCPLLPVAASHKLLIHIAVRLSTKKLANERARNLAVVVKMSIARANYMFIRFWGVKEVQVCSFLHVAFKARNSLDYFGYDTNCGFLVKIGRSL